MEFLSQYNCKIVYLKGEDNCIADTLLRTTFKAEEKAGGPWSKGCGEAIVAVLGLNPQECIRSLTHINIPEIEMVAPTLTLEADKELLKIIRGGYKEDGWYTKILEAPILLYRIQIKDGIMYMGDWMIIQQMTKVWEALFHLAHDVFSHFGFKKSYGLL